MRLKEQMRSAADRLYTIRSPLIFVFVMILGCASSFHEYVYWHWLPIIGKEAAIKREEFFYGFLRNLMDTGLVLMVALSPRSDKLKTICLTWLGWCIFSGIWDEKWGHPYNLDDFEILFMIAALTTSIIILWKTQKIKTKT